jgi:hypothetical protein
MKRLDVNVGYRVANDRVAVLMALKAFDRCDDLKDEERDSVQREDPGVGPGIDPLGYLLPRFAMKLPIKG